MKLSVFWCICAWEWWFCDLWWRKWVNFVYCVLEKAVCVVWFGEVECLLMTMCMRMMILWPATVKISEFWCPLCLRRANVWVVLVKMSDFWCMCAWEGCYVVCLAKLSEFYVIEFIGLWSVMVKINWILGFVYLSLVFFFYLCCWNKCFVDGVIVYMEMLYTSIYFWGLSEWD